MARQIIKEWKENGMDCFTEIVKGSDGIDREFSKKIFDGTEYLYGTPYAVMVVLDNARKSGQRIRVFYGHADGKDWHEENYVLGKIGRSTGKPGIPLLIHNVRSMGGGAILDDCIVKIVACNTKKVLYQNPNYDGGTYEIREVSIDLYEQGYITGVWINGQNHANFRKPGQAERWVAYMKGERMAK